MNVTFYAYSSTDLIDFAMNRRDTLDVKFKSESGYIYELEIDITKYNIVEGSFGSIRISHKQS